MKKPANFTHGMSKLSEYQTWRGMKYRCYNPKSNDYKNYGARGITVCDRWMVFENFYADMGKRPIGHKIDRIDFNGNYAPENCRWATQEIHYANRRKRVNFAKKKLSNEVPNMLEFRKIDRDSLRKNLWDWMNENPITPNKLAKEIGVAPKTLNDFMSESNTRATSIKMLLLVNKFLKDKHGSKAD